MNHKMQWTSKKEVRTVMKRIKNGKAVGPDDISVEREQWSF